jgi:hypothetical protein
MAAIDRVADRVRARTPVEAARAFHQMAARFKSAAGWISKNVQRTNESLALFNLLAVSASYLKVAGDNIETHISVFAMVTRNLYEVNLQVRDILRSPDGIQRWQAEAIADKIQMLEGILELDTVSDTASQRAVLRTEIDRLRFLRDKHGLPNIKPVSAGNIANSVGLSTEHSALFRLFSKLVHPSSYLVNDYKNAASDEIRMTLQIQAQLYGWDTFGRICDAVSMPESVRESFEASAPGASSAT